MGDVIEFTPQPSESTSPVGTTGEIAYLTPHATGLARCLQCGHEWEETAPVGKQWFACPSCKLEKGCWVWPVLRGSVEFECNCGNRLFRINENGPYCSKCGNYYRGV